ncbi:glycoside hydrolase family 3 N-terminal domain-containing protein [Taibaiella chishuiensis]|uniref:beta-N-acetylhexosaminidase n=1 Tax=Taibaiella chishuiensis TaxID=1434707 RepID=A0A2P8D483_9BACT|nr:glycoside hydrolase family 3 N-terminal domain-containing protein [Taibaiella chishuiensis]PSK92038.1 beta-glucosidase-like glycosyl hydrolase [Taibaiella chishuiensis]
MHSIRYIFLFSLLLTACHSEAFDRPGTGAPKKTTAPETPPSFTQLFFQPDAAAEAQVDAVYRSLSPKERAAQMIMTASSTSPKLGYPFDKARDLVTGDISANLVFLKGTTTAFKNEVKQLDQAKASSKLKTLYACDCEPSLINSKWSDISGIQTAAQQTDTESVITNTGKINEIVKRVGVQLNFAPVVDIAANKSVINKRSFGSDPAAITLLSGQFVKTSQDAGIAATLKHFPGHGAVTGDSHKQSVYIDGPLTELNTFKTLIQSETPPIAVMVGHIIVKNNDRYSTHGLPATLSPVIVTDLLRRELGYEGIITTDALNMEAAAKVPDADWKAVQAGVDLVLMPADARALNKRIVDALAKNDAVSRQLEASVKRIIRLKLALAAYKQ